MSCYRFSFSKRLNKGLEANILRIKNSIASDSRINVSVPYLTDFV